jgi:hypothetical protein
MSYCCLSPQTYAEVIVRWGCLPHCRRGGGVLLFFFFQPALQMQYALRRACCSLPWLDRLTARAASWISGVRLILDRGVGQGPGTIAQGQISTKQEERTPPGHPHRCRQEALGGRAADGLRHTGTTARFVAMAQWYRSMYVVVSPSQFPHLATRDWTASPSAWSCRAVVSESGAP